MVSLIKPVLASFALGKGSNSLAIIFVDGVLYGVFHIMGNSCGGGRVEGWSTR